ncbi:hypothetical protein [Leifsonia soli]|uniref:Uncharacterized protein n=1 Tax=Leifsonia soli TaxID=582665 RepID=A0A852T0P8_9MICO|nr:hypothetical protein [Leifsonia soli]NYD74220.1 hypothetical protein [Leifsonia soli]
MTLATLVDLEESLHSLDEVESWGAVDVDGTLSEADVLTREIVPLTSDFATMGGSRPRTRF